MGIGPQIPAHLLDSGPHSTSGDENDDQGPQPHVPILAGPQIPSNIETSFKNKNELAPVTAGPQIPMGLLKKSTPVDDEDDDSDDYAPALPPDLVAAQSAPAGPSRPSPSAAGPSTGKRQVGPSFPTYAPTYNADSYYSDDDSDDDVGPKPLPAGMQHEEPDAVKEFIAREERRRKELEEASKPKALKRDEWMLVPPSSSDLLGKLDPTKLKARQFSRSAAPVQGKQDNSLWTETPAERQQRIADEVSGKKRRVTDQPVDEQAEAGKKRRRRDEDVIRKGVDEYTEKLRGPALIAQHAAGRKPEDEPKDDRIWDHSRDMSLGGRLMDDDKRNKLVREAKGLGDRFGTGRSGGFL
ncbi:hypothetical protein BDQ12DRAFT_651055 [Crucibulum laeve]|uniref:DUF3752 domain-containing protein n=1 Tax=Crucibulum laeve TaxID=68775 RepID=A0A5C3LZX0_9AGAR|nr:hypothetical protein BDQ12DRAFT_651055 [Crucibulum laeve]